MSTISTSQPGGRLVVVGSGLQSPRHVSERTISEIGAADVVFALASPFAYDWLRSQHPDIRNLCDYYGDQRDRRESYREMQQAMIDAVHRGRKVCCVLYGHPGIFAQVGHEAIRQLSAQGFETRMEPGISAEACLYADLGIDPGRTGVQSFEATQFLVYRHTPHPAVLLLLWQVALAGNLDCIGFEAHRNRLQVLVDKLVQWYSPQTEVILYEAAQLPIEDFRADHLALVDLPEASYHEYTTLVIPPTVLLKRDEKYRDALRELD